MANINKNSSTKLWVATSALMLASGLTSSVASAQTRTFTVYNESNYRIEQLYVSNINNIYWGTDLLGNTVMPSHGAIPVAVAPGYYDVKLVDEDGDTCEIDDINFFTSKTWIMTDDLLISCEFLSENH